MNKKVIAIDVYGTMLPSEGMQVKRKGLIDFLRTYLDTGIILCTCSDALVRDVLTDFEEARLSKGFFYHFFKMERDGDDFYNKPKNFKNILSFYEIRPDHLTVIGDRKIRDIDPAIKLGCNAILVPHFRSAEDNSYDMRELITELYPFMNHA